MAVAAGLGGCADRARITYPTDDDIGPTTVIVVPSADTSAQAGAFVTIGGYSLDPDGVDSIYFDAAGTPERFPAFQVPADEQRDSVSWSIAVATRLLAGDTIVVFAQAADRLGNVGTSAARRIAITP
ncbi:MAG TPA: hypothetical protein VFS40_08500 [Gemmatimonadales bacterium]|nr:hypothetical protein [Gemmatimonadales bacterium]